MRRSPTSNCRCSNDNLLSGREMQDNRHLPPDLQDLDSGEESPVDGDGVCLHAFFAYMPMHSYIFAPTREMWPAASVNARIPPIPVGDKAISAAAWLDQNKPVEQMTWVPASRC